MKHSIRNRIVVGNIIGLVAGLLAFFWLPVLGADISLQFGFGLILFYVILGLLTGFAGTMKHHPYFGFPVSWWFRGSVMGLLMHTMLVLVAYDQIANIAESINLFGMISPWWALLDGVILGMIMAYFETSLAGEGEIPAQ